MRNLAIVVACSLALTILLPEHGYSQNFGAGFMRLTMGARQKGMGQAFAGVGDDIYTMLWNPGGLSFIRRWQYGVGIDRHIADTRQISFMHARQMSLLGSPRFTVGAGIFDLGMPDWDSTQGARPPASAGAFMGVASVGYRPYKWGKIAKHFGVGGTLKFVRSTLDQFSAFGVFGDVGIMLRPTRFRLPSALSVFDYGIATVGAARQNFTIKGLQFDTEQTAVPSLWRIGGAIGAGRHQSFTLLFAFDSDIYNDSDNLFSVGTELWWHQIIGGRVGYEFNGDAAGGLTLGAGLRLGTTGFTRSLLRGTEARLDFADAGNGDVLGRTRRTSIVYYPNGPEEFGMQWPPEAVGLDDSNVKFAWGASEDPDPYDELTYYIIVGADRRQVAEAGSLAVQYPEKLQAVEPDSDIATPFFRVIRTTDISTVTRIPAPDLDFYWSVAAVDLDYHSRLAHGSPTIRSFSIRRPDLVVKSIRLKHHEWVEPADNDVQGALRITIKNIGTGAATKNKAELFAIRVDTTLTEAAADTALWYATRQTDRIRNLSSPFIVDALRPGQETTVEFPWNEEEPGQYRFLARVDVENSEQRERFEDNNRKFVTIYTIPKWNAQKIILPTKAEYNPLAYVYKNIEIPVIPAVFFAPRSVDVDDSYSAERYLGLRSLQGVLRTLANRLNENRDIELTIRGYADPTTDKGAPGKGYPLPSLALERANEVKRALLRLGVRPVQLLADSTDKFGVRRHRRSPQGAVDEDRIGEEYRRAEFSVEKPEWAAKLFWPVRVPTNPYLPEKVNTGELPQFCANVFVPATTKSWSIEISSRGKKVGTALPDTSNRHTGEQAPLGCWQHNEWQPAPEQLLQSTATWNGKNSSIELNAPRKLQSSLVVIDNQGRRFTTRAQDFILQASSSVLVEKIFTLFDFDIAADPRFDFDNTRLEQFADTLLTRVVAAAREKRDHSLGPQTTREIRIRFQGHADEIGDADYNLKLSMQRAREVTERFRKVAMRKAPDYGLEEADIPPLIDPPEAMGETIPFEVSLDDMVEIIGVNDNPVGRNLNRRVMVQMRETVTEQRLTQTRF